MAKRRPHRSSQRDPHRPRQAPRRATHADDPHLSLMRVIRNAIAHEHPIALLDLAYTVRRSTVAPGEKRRLSLPFAAPEIPTLTGRRRVSSERDDVLRRVREAEASCDRSSS